MNLFKNYKRYRSLRVKGIKRRVALLEFKHQTLTRGDAVFLAITPVLAVAALTYLMYIEAGLITQQAQKDRNHAYSLLELKARELHKVESRLVDIFNGRYFRMDGALSQYGRCNAATGCPEDHIQ